MKNLTKSPVIIGIIVILVITVILFLIGLPQKFFKGMTAIAGTFFKRAKGLSEQDEQDKKEVEDSIDEIPVDDSQLSHEPEIYRIQADDLQKAMAGVGTDINTINGIILSNSVEENKLVYKEFGVREYWTGLGSDYLTLIGWFKQEISGSDSWFYDDQLTPLKEAFAGSGLWD